MKLKYDDKEIDVEVFGLIKFAKEVCKKMQLKDDDYSDCWTACIIEFKEGGICPEFEYGSIADLKGDTRDNMIYVEVPL